jgi:hypothetical protein
MQWSSHVDDLIISGADTPGALAGLRAFVAARGQTAGPTLERHLAQPRYRPALTRVAMRAGEVVGYALIDHHRLRLGAATLESGRLKALDTRLSQADPPLFAAILGDCLGVLVQEQLPLALLSGPAESYVPFGFAPYRYHMDVSLALREGTPGTAPTLRPAAENDLEDLAALYDATYRTLPLSAVLTASDWRSRLAGGDRLLAIEDNQRRVVAYCSVEPEHERLALPEAAAADAGAARALCRALQALAQAQGRKILQMALSPWLPVAQAALHLGGEGRLSATNQTSLAGVVDLPMLLAALAPELEQRLAGSRYAGWSGNLRVEIATERITLALETGRVTIIDGSRPADLRLRNVALPALAQLLLGYRATADLRATGGLACDDSALGLLDALFPVVLAASQAIE